MNVNLAFGFMATTNERLETGVRNLVWKFIKK